MDIIAAIATGVLCVLVCLDGLGSNGIAPWNLFGVESSAWSDCWLDFFDMLSEGIMMPLGALLIALYIKNAYNILMFAWSFYAAAAGLPAFAALYWKKATKAGVLSGMAAGFTVTIAWKLLGQPFGLGATVPGAIACALALVLVSLATCKKHPSVYLDPRKA